MSETYLLHAEKLAVGYGGRILLKDIDIRLKAGHILTLIGPNGAGKSTILKTLSRQLHKIGGCIELEGQAMEDFSPQEWARTLSLLLTQRPHTERMSNAEIVESGRYPYTGALGLLGDKDLQAVDSALKLLHIESLADVDFMHGSDGQKQRVLLARALCQEPRVLVLDEPTSYLDIRYKLDLLKILRQLAAERELAIVMTLHELDLARKVSDEVLCIKDHQIRAYGPTGEIFEDGFIEDLYDLPGSYNSRFGNPELPPSEGPCKIFVIAGNGRGIPVFRHLQQRGLPFATGILHANDSDAELARQIANDLVEEKPFSPIGDESFARAAGLLDEMEMVICALEEERGDYGPGNERNRELLELARRRCRVVKADLSDL